MRTTLLIFVIGSFCWSCQELFRPKSEDRAVARVYDNYLRVSDIEANLPAGLSYADSIDFARNFIEDWATNLLVLHRAELNLSETQKNLDQQVKEYRNSLLRFAYQQEMLLQLLDTNISDEASQAYYDKEYAKYQLKQPIVQATYAYFVGEAPDSEKFIRAFRYGELPEEKDFIEDYCFQYAYDFQLNDTLWVSLENLESKLNITYSGSPSRFLRFNKFYEIKEEGKWILVRFYNYLLEGAQAPLDYVKPEIESVIINQRKLEVLKQIEQDLYNDALRKNHLEIL